MNRFEHFCSPHCMQQYKSRGRHLVFHGVSRRVHGHTSPVEASGTSLEQRAGYPSIHDVRLGTLEKKTCCQQRRQAVIDQGQRTLVSRYTPHRKTSTSITARIHRVTNTVSDGVTLDIENTLLIDHNSLTIITTSGQASSPLIVMGRKGAHITLSLVIVQGVGKQESCYTRI